MQAPAQDEGWVPAIHGLVTLRVWRPGKSSVLARLRAAWILLVLATLAIVGAAALFGQKLILSRFYVQVGWIGFGWFIVGTWIVMKRLSKDLVAAPPERIATVLWSRWYAAAFAASGPLLMAVTLARQDGGIPSHAVYWAGFVSLFLQVAIAPSISRFRRLEEDRTAADGSSVMAAVSAPTTKTDRARGRTRTPVE